MAAQLPRTRGISLVQSSTNSVVASPASARAATRHILGFVYFSFIIHLTIGLPLAVLPA